MAPTPDIRDMIAAQMSGTIDTMTAARKPEAADLCGTFKEIHRVLDVMRWMAIATLAIMSVNFGMVLAILLQM